MKKLFYILLLSLASSIAFTACTEDEVRPAKPISGGGGGSQDPI
jgi:hypothetical protein